MKLKLLLKVLETAAARGVVDADVSGVTCDSRRVRAGYIFCAVPGTSVDGRAFVTDAVRRGAVAVVTAQDVHVPDRVCQVKVPDVRVALARLAVAFHGGPSAGLKMVGVTGTNGKTTITYILHDVLSAHGMHPGLLGTVEYVIGERRIPALRTTPSAEELQWMLAQMRDVGCDTAIMEVSSHALVQQRVAGIEFDVAMYTNLTRDHLDYHNTMQEYFDAKARLFEELGTGTKTGCAVINADDHWGGLMRGRVPGGVECLTYGTADGADVRAEHVEVDTDGVRFSVLSPWGRADVTSELLGRFNVSNLLGVIAAAGALEVPLAEIVRAVAEAAPVQGRMEQIPTARGFQVFVDYAHTDDALRNVLRTLREITAKRLIVVFGCGGDRDRTKRPMMGRVASELADLAVLTSDNPRSEDPMGIIADVREGVADERRLCIIPERADAIRYAVHWARPGDTVLVAGKGHETFQEFAGRTVPFDDRAVVRTALEEDACAAI